jgi:glycosyltransferase involved in cell wall biosynthesis
VDGSERMILADTRWQGKHGIGRYATEVLSRLTVPFARMPDGGSPSSPTDFVRKRISVEGTRPTSVYSPGYNGFLRNVPQTVTVHDLIHLRGANSAKYRPYYDLFLKPSIKRNGHVVTISETSRIEILNWLGTDRVEVVNAGEGASEAFVREGIAHEASRPYFLYVGNLRAHKNVDTLMAAMARVADSDLVVVSSDSAAVEALASAHGIAERVTVFSETSDEQLASLYRGARATVQPSLLEGFGLPALESALCGTPVVFYEGCASVKEICAGHGVAVSSPDDAAEWAAALTSVEVGSTFADGVVTREAYSWGTVAAKVDGVLARFSAGRAG